MDGSILRTIPGLIADVWNLQVAFIVPLIACACVACCGSKGYKVGRAHK